MCIGRIIKQNICSALMLLMAKSISLILLFFAYSYAMINDAAGQIASAY
jgi:hypothetical protein